MFRCSAFRPRHSKAGSVGDLDFGMGARLTDGLPWLTQDSFCPFDRVESDPFWFLSLWSRHRRAGRVAYRAGVNTSKGKGMNMWKHKHVESWVEHMHTLSFGVCQQLRKYWKEGTGMNRCTNTLGNMQYANTLTGPASVSILMRWTLDQFAFIADTIPTWRRLQPCRSKLWGLDWRKPTFFSGSEQCKSSLYDSTIRIWHRTLWDVHM